MNKTVALVAVLTGCMPFVGSCTGGCWLKADPVLTDPQTGCLTLFGGHSASDPTVCAVPKLGGVNNCTDNLTLPKRSASDEALVVVPGATVDWWVPAQSVPPVITVTGSVGGQADYAIFATLGSQTTVIAFSVR